MSEHDWEMRYSYDYRFCGLMLNVAHKGELSPQYTISMRDVFKAMPRHEVLACLQMADDPALPKDGNIDAYRRSAIRDTIAKGDVVLDIGGYDGWAAALALECGASRAICLDNHQYEHYGWDDKKLPGVEYINGNVMDFVLTLGRKSLDDDCIDNVKTGTCCLPRPDTIINYNVLYHVKNPWAFLDHCRCIIKPTGTMLLCTLFRYHDGPWIYLYEPRECNPSDETVYFGPSLSAIERLLKATGWDFEQLGLSFDRVVYRCKPTSGFARTHEDT